MTLVPTTTGTDIALADLADTARDYAAAARSENTIRAYRAGWSAFAAWAEARGLATMPAAPEAVALYVADIAGTVSPATIDARLAAISAAHRAVGHPSPTKHEAVRVVRRGVRVTHGTEQRRVRPVTVPDLRRMVDDLGDDLTAARDRALLLVGFAAALRRSELVGLDVADVTETTYQVTDETTGELVTRDGLLVRVRRSKTDQEGAGRTIAIPAGDHAPTCPLRAWRTWLRLSGITEGPAFRRVRVGGAVGADRLSGQAVANIIKGHAERAGLDPATVAGHSLRAGLATAAAERGVPERVIAATTGHKSMTILRRYIRDGDLFRENAAGAVGL